MLSQPLKNAMITCFASRDVPYCVGVQGRLTGLTALNLSNNSLTTLPRELGNLTKLQQIDLKGNPLESPYK